MLLDVVSSEMLMLFQGRLLSCLVGVIIVRKYSPLPLLSVTTSDTKLTTDVTHPYKLYTVIEHLLL